MKKLKIKQQGTLLTESTNCTISTDHALATRTDLASEREPLVEISIIESFTKGVNEDAEENPPQISEFEYLILKY